MDNIKVSKHKILNYIQSLLLLVTLSGILSSVAYLVGGSLFAWITLAAAGGLYLITPAASPWIAMKYYRGREIGWQDAPVLKQIVQTLSEKAGLSRPPALFYLPSRQMAAFAVGSKGNAAIAVSAGILNALSRKETSGVLGHEISHIRNNDMQVMSLARVVGSVTRFMSMAGQALLILQIPLILMTEYRISFMALALLIFAPVISGLIELALSRVREFSADLGSAELLGDPEPLASALSKIEYSHRSVFERIFRPVRNRKSLSFLMTHPPTRERIKRLMAMKKSSDQKLSFPERSERYFETERSRLPEQIIYRYPQRIVRREPARGYYRRNNIQLKII
jgi:heat shock protein HtpX